MRFLRRRHVHQIGVEQHHKRRLHEARMLQIPSSEALGVQAVNGSLVNEIPVRQELNPYVLDAKRACLLQGKLCAFKDELVVFVVAVHQDNAPCPILDEVPYDILRKHDERHTAETGGATKVKPASRPLLRTITKIDWRSHNSRDTITAL